jgi:hypothetical protein
MSSSLRIRVFAALAASAIAAAGCSGAVSIEDGEGESGERLTLPNDPGGEGAEIAQGDGTANLLGDCGDGTCEPGENCALCSQDCGVCPSCGNGVCNPTEDCSSCPGDCGACPCAHDLCAGGEALDATCDPCVAQICAVDSFCCNAAWDGLCVSEVTSVCGDTCPVVCGNGWCEAGEDCNSCSQDCGACPTCGDAVCSWGEDCNSCSQDCGACPTCGDAECHWTEDCNSCSQDCGACPTCGDGTCHWTEDCNSCSQDCGACPTCGDGTCNGGETCGSCSQDCGACVCHDVCSVGTPLDPACGQCEAQVCAADFFCCQAAWDGLCVSEAVSMCGQQCP